MGNESVCRLSRSFAANGVILLLALMCTSLLAAPQALGGTPTDANLAIPFPPDGQYMFRTLDESAGTVVFAIPPDSSSPFRVYSWTQAAGLTALTTGGQDNPAIDGQIVVWVESDSIKGRNLSTGDPFDLSDGADQSQPDVSGDWVVWTENLHEIHAYNLTTHVARLLSSTTSLKQCPRVCGDLVMWMDRRDEFFYNIWGCRLSSGGEFAISEGYGDRMNPDTDGRYVVWADHRTVGSAIYGYDTTTATEFEVSPSAFPTAKHNPRISNGLVVWAWDSGAGNPYGLAARKLPSGVEFKVCDGGNNPVPDGNKIYHNHGTEAWCATVDPIAGSLSVHQWTGTPGFTSDTMVALDVVAVSDAGTITDMDFGGGWEPFAVSKTVGPLADGWQAITAQVRDDVANVSQISSAPFYVDTVAPATDWYLSHPHETTPLTPDWFSSDVILHLDVDDASGVGTVYSQIGSGPWLRGGPLRFDVRADHSLDGWYTVHVYSKDAAGNVETAPQTIEFGIDTQPPAAVGVLPATAQSGRPTALRFRIRDPGVTSGSAAVRVVIFDRSGRRVARLAAVGVPVNVDVARRFVCLLPRGSYRFGVTAIDRAGNGTVRMAFNRLVVK